MNIRFKLSLVGILGLVVVVSSETSGACHLCLHGLCYEKTKLGDSYFIPNIHNFVIDRTDNTLYYHSTFSTMKTGYAVYALNLEDKTVKIVRNNYNERTLAVDQKNREIYIANRTDIIKYNPVTNKTDHILHTDVYVKKLQFKDKLYVLGYTNVTRIYTLEEFGLVTIEPIQENFIVDFVVDKRGDIYYSQRSNQNFKFTAAKSKVTRILSNEKIAYTTDKDDEVYFIVSLNNSVWKIDYDLNLPVPVGSFDLSTFYSVPITAQFDKNGNIAYVDYDVNSETGSQRLHYLTANSQRCTT